jgi:hypothetical protein
VMKHSFVAICLSAFMLSTALAQRNRPVPISRNADSPGREFAIRLTPSSRDGVDQDATLSGMRKKVTSAVANPPSAVTQLPPALTVNTAVLLELHALRLSAVSLCLQLPVKYRMRLPQCAEIFEHEIRLAALAKNKR